MATGVSSAAAAATLTAISTGRGDTPISTAAATAMGMTMSAVAVLLMSWPSTAVSRKSPTAGAYGPASPTASIKPVGELLGRPRLPAWRG